MHSGVISTLTKIRPRYVNRALPLQVADHLRHRILRRDRNQHVHVVRLQMTFQYPALTLTRQLAQNFTQMHPNLPKQAPDDGISEGAVLD